MIRITISYKKPNRSRKKTNRDDAFILIKGKIKDKEIGRMMGKINKLESRLK